MNFKTLLLGSAAAMVLAGGAQAADLTVAEPVDYVKVCDAFGAGFFYSPGTDTCIKIGGYVKFGTNVTGAGFSYGDRGESFSDSTSHYGQFYTEASIQLTASSVTEYGNLTGWLDVRAATGSSYEYPAATDTFGHIDSAYIQLGPLKAGHFTSAFDFLGGYTDTGAYRADSSTDHIQLTYAMGGFGIIASIEDGSDRKAPFYGTSYYSPVYGSGPNNYYRYFYNYDNPESIPDLVAALTYATGPISAKLSGAYVNDGANKTSYYGYTGQGDGSLGDPEIYEYNYSTKHGYAVQLGIEVALDNFSKGDKFGIQGVYAKDAPAYTGWQKFFGSNLAQWDGAIYGGFASYIHYWNPGLWSAAEVSYLKSEKYDTDLWQVSASTDWSIVKNLDLMLDGSYAKANYDYGDQDKWAVNLWLKRSW